VKYLAFNWSTTAKIQVQDLLPGDLIVDCVGEPYYLDEAFNYLGDAEKSDVIGGLIIGFTKDDDDQARAIVILNGELFASTSAVLGAFTVCARWKQ